MSLFCRNTMIVLGLLTFVFVSDLAAGQKERNPRFMYEVGYNHMGETYLKNGVAELLSSGNSANAAENLDRAEEAFINAIEANPAAVDPQINLARLYHMRQDFEQATAQYEKVLRLAPDNVNVLVDMALLKIEMGQIDDAAKYLERAKHLTTPEELTDRNLDRYVRGVDRSKRSGVKKASSR